jgi:hypothetical protein
MARITYNADSVGGIMLARGVDHIRKGRDLISRAKSLADSISAGGVTPALIEGQPEFGVPVHATAPGTYGALFYTALGNMKTNAATVSDAAIADLDNGG